VTPDAARNEGEDAVAESIVRGIAPRTLLSVGPGAEELVAALRSRGVEADALPEVPAAELDRDYDLLLCLGGLDGLQLERAAAAIAGLCRHTGDIVFSIAPGGGDTSPWEWWAEQFALQGFFRDVEHDATCIAPSAVRFRRSDDPLPRVAARLEGMIARLGRELDPLRARVDELVDALSQSESLIVDTERRRAEAEDRRAAAERVAEDMRRIEHSASYRAAHSMSRRFRRAFPSETRRGRVATLGAHGMVRLAEEGPSSTARRAVERLRRHPGSASPPPEAAPPVDPAQEEYERWLVVSAPRGRDLAAMRDSSRRFAARPLVSIVMPTYNSEESWLREAIESVREQAYENWELCIADDCSPDPRVREILAEEAARDPRIKVVTREANGGIAAASNSALESATGEWVGLLDHDDLLQPHALYRVVERINAEPQVDLIYSDEDKLLLDGRRGHPFFKPDWSPDLLTSINYVCHFTVIRKAVLDTLGGFRTGFDGSQDHELFLRITDSTSRVAHIADVLYTWRMVPSSSALNADAKPGAATARRAAIEEALERRGAVGRVEPARQPGWYHARYALRGRPPVTIVIPTRDRVDLLRACVESIRSVSTYRKFRITIVDNDSRDPATLDYLRGAEFSVVRHPGNFNYAAIVNHGVRALDPLPDEHVLLLNNDMEVRTPDWIEAMLEHSQRREVGAVGCRLLYPDGRPQHEGVVTGIGGTANNVDLSSYFGLGTVIRDVGAVTGAAMMLRRSTWDEMGGLDETLRVAFNDIDLCLRLRKQGLRIVYTPLAELVHFESASRGRMHPVEDERRFAERWGSGERLLDPYGNPNVLWYSPLRLRPHPPLPEDNGE
jgi:GT2 family glycosyltransferase